MTASLSARRWSFSFSLFFSTSRRARDVCSATTEDADASEANVLVVLSSEQTDA